MQPKSHIIIYQLAVLLMLTMGLLSTTAALADDSQPLAVATQERSTAPTTSMPSQWGIEVTAVHMAAAGNMVDFRYKVLDADKAATLFAKKVKPYLIHQKSGKVLSVPRTAKVGPLMSSYKPKQDRIYWMFFGNQAKLVQSGDAVTVVIGDFKIENLIVG